MKRIWVNYVNDVLLFVTGTILAISSLLVWVVIPKGYNATWLTWIAIHKWSGFALLVEALVHAALHFRWMTTMTARLFRRKG